MHGMTLFMKNRKLHYLYKSKEEVYNFFNTMIETNLFKL